MSKKSNKNNKAKESELSGRELALCILISILVMIFIFPVGVLVLRAICWMCEWVSYFTLTNWPWPPTL